MPAIYTHPILVHQQHLDGMNHVNNVVYVQWVQDAAAAHWNSAATPAMLKEFNWVVLRHEIDYRQAAVLNDELIAKTWVKEYSGVRSVRVVQIIRKKDERMLVEATTTWCLLHATTNRPARITDEITSVFVSSE